MKFDNGSPFGEPERAFLPAMALWLIGLGIEVIWNRAATPQDNAKVERMQGVTKSWSQAATCNCIDTLRLRLDQACAFQRDHYPTRILKGRTRQQAFPGLAASGRPFDPQAFEIQLVRNFVAKGTWERKVSCNGTVELGHRRYSVGRPHRGRNVYLFYNPDTDKWMVFLDKKLLIASPDANLNTENVKKLTPFQKESHSTDSCPGN